MPAKSKAQQKFFGMMVANPEKRKAAGIKKQDAEDFASTGDTSDLPEKVSSGKKRKISFRPKHNPGY